MTIPKWLKSYLSEQDLINIEKAVAEVEQYTTGEIAPMIVYRSANAGWIPSFVFVLLLLILNLIADSFLHFRHLEFSYLNVLIYGVCFLLLIPLSRVLAKCVRIQQMLLHPLDRDQSSYQRAITEFYTQGLNKTDGSTGILLFVSLVDREVIILGDQGINSKITPETWNTIKDHMVAHLKSKHMGQGFIDAIHECGDILKLHFPAKPDSKNELCNKLIIKE